MFRIQFPSCQIWKHLLFITTCKWSLQTTTKNHWLITIANLHTVHNFLWADLQHYIAYATSILSQLFLSYILCIVYHVVYYHIVYYHIHFLWDPFNREYTCILIMWSPIANISIESLQLWYTCILCKRKFPGKYITILHEEIGSQHETNAKKRCCQHWVHSLRHWAVNGRMWISLHHALINKKFKRVR